MIQGRALHFVLKIGDRKKNYHFFKNILGMTVLRHEEFKEGCEAQCNGPYDNRWSKTMFGYGPESDHFVFELTYNYGVKEYQRGNDFKGAVIKSTQPLKLAEDDNYPFDSQDGECMLTSPDGYKFYIINKDVSKKEDKVQEIILSSSNLEKSKSYWHGLLNMPIISEDQGSVIFCYADKQAKLRLLKIDNAIDHASAYGRIAFSVTEATLKRIIEVVNKAKAEILKPLVKLDTPGKATVQVVILADPDGHEICFVEEDGFRDLSQVDPDAYKGLEKYILKDPFQDNDTD